MNEADRWRRIDALFSRVLSLEPPARGPFLEEHCREDADLRRQVELLLQAHEAADDFLEAPPLDLMETAADTRSYGGTERGGDGSGRAAPGDGRIGPYRLLREIGRGGMGDVYLAERADGQFEQRVAIKRIRGGFDFGGSHDRFRLERQILARLEHPNITRLVDGGVEDGCPYLVMEYVEGTPIVRYCDDRRLSIAGRLALFATVCRAVHYAHRNLIVHRDLKPSNILVTEDGQVKLLDFGIAKLLDEAADTFPLVETQPHMRLMTPGYASPEQVRGETVTTASDVYALGVVLYELLTGRLPYRLPGRHWKDVERVVCETMPERPSTAVLRVDGAAVAQGSSLRFSPAAIGQARGTTVERLRRQLAGDLDTIVLMALRKEPERRYASAEQFAEDVERFLTQRPVRAQKDTVLYRATKFVRRNRIGVAAAAAVLLALVGGLGAAAWQAGRATREAEKAHHLNVFLQSMLASADPAKEGRSITVAEVLDAAAAQVGEQLENRPDIEAEVRSTLGMTYRGLGLFAEGEVHLRRAYELRRTLHGPDHPETAFELNRLGMLLHASGRSADAEALFREALAIERRHVAAGDPRLGNLLNNLALAVQEQGRYEEALPLYQQALKILRPDATEWNYDLSTVVSDYATLLHALGRLDEAEAYFREVLQNDRRILPADHFGIAIDLNNLSQVLQLQGKYVEAEVLLREAYEINRKRLGDEHPELGVILANRASIAQDLRRYDEAEALYREALAMQRRVLGHEHADVAQTLNNLASLLQDRDDYDAAEPVQREAVQVARASYGETHPLTAALTANLGRVLYEQAKTAEAEQLFRYALPVLQESLPDHPLLAKALVGLGTLLADRGDVQEAEPLLREGLRIRRSVLPAGDWQTAQAESALGAALAGLGRYEEAEALLTAAAPVLEKERGAGSREAQRVRAHLDRLYTSRGQPDRAALARTTG